MKLVDTDFLIDRQREWAAGEAGPATTFLREHDATSFAISTVSLLEFLEGYEHPRDGEVLLDAYARLPVTDGVARRGSRLRRKLRAEGQMIGDFDVLIAATALDAGIPLVTGNVAHFQRVPARSNPTGKPAWNPANRLTLDHRPWRRHLPGLCG